MWKKFRSFGARGAKQIKRFICNILSHLSRLISACLCSWFRVRFQFDFALVKIVKRFNNSERISLAIRLN